MNGHCSHKIQVSPGGSGRRVEVLDTSSSKRRAERPNLILGYFFFPPKCFF